MVLPSRGSSTRPATKIFAVGLISLVSLGLSSRPTSDIEDSSASYEVSLTPRGEGHARVANVTAHNHAVEAKAQLRTFTDAELHTAFHDLSKGMPQHMLDSLHSVSLLQEGNGAKPLMEGTSRGSVGQVLRGVLDFNGYAFALHLDRGEWTKVKNEKHWYNSNSDGYDHLPDYVSAGINVSLMALGSMSFKLLRYPKNPEKQKTEGRTWKEVDLEHILSSGWTKVTLEGWWDDQTNHFRGITKDSYDFPWLSHAMIPWREIDLRFDDTGAAARFDWYPGEDDYEDVNGYWTGRKGVLTFSKSDIKFAMFRLDDLPDGQDPKSVFKAMTFEKSIQWEYTIYTDKCEPGDNDKDFKCKLWQRPLSVVSEDLKEYHEAPYGHTGHGDWFTFMGELGYVMLHFTPSTNNNYIARPLNSHCPGLDPCPFIRMQSFDTQFLADAIMFRPRDPRLPGSLAQVQASKEERRYMKASLERKEEDLKNHEPNALFYAVFDNDLMSSIPSRENLQGISAAERSTRPIIPPRDHQQSNPEAGHPQSPFGAGPAGNPYTEYQPESAMSPGLDDPA